MISVVVPIYNEERYIRKCLDSIIQSDYPKEEMEVLLVDGGSEDGTIAIIEEYRKRYRFFKLLHNPKKIAPTAMNIGIKKAKGDYIFILSAHASYESGYFRELVEYAKRLKAECVGPALVTDVKNSTKTSIAIKNVLSDIFGVGSRFRVGSEEVTQVDTVAFGCYDRKVFDRIGLFDERLVRNQDIELNKRIIRAGGKIYMIPHVKAIYYARETFKELAKNNFQNGKWNILTAYYTKTLSSLSLRHFIPLLFVVSLLLFLILGIFVSKLFFYLFVLELGIYLAVIGYRSYKIKKGTSFLHQLAAFLTLHLSYGFGSLAGIFEVLKRKFYDNKK